MAPCPRAEYPCSRMTHKPDVIDWDVRPLSVDDMWRFWKLRADPDRRVYFFENAVFPRYGNRALPVPEDSRRIGRPGLRAERLCGDLQPEQECGCFATCCR